MPHPTSSGSYAPEPSISRSSAKTDYDSGLEKFPDHIDSLYTRANGVRSASPATTAARPNGYAIGLNGGGSTHLTAERWQPRRDNTGKSVKWDRGTGAARGHHRQQKSITQAFHNIRERSGSVSQNAHEIADALRAPISPKLIVRRRLEYIYYTDFYYIDLSPMSLNIHDVRRRGSTLLTRPHSRSCVSYGTCPPP